MPENLDPRSQVLVIGGGVAGISAALDLADQGHHVYLVERFPSIGGKMAQLDKTFPTLDCSICILAPKMVEAARHPRIELLTYSEVVAMSPQNKGELFQVTIKKKARYIDAKKCTGCGNCAEICPVRGISNEYEVGLKETHAAHIPFLQAVPSTYLINEEKCLHLNYGICGLCSKNCKAEAIDFSMKSEEVTVVVASIIVATGFDLMDISSLKNYGYGKYSNVLTSLEFERIMSASGPTGGEIVRPHDRKHPHEIACILCVGSRDVCSKPYCSKFCCMYSAKEAIITKEHASDTEILIYYNDIRAPGKYHEEFIEKAKKDYNVKYIKGLPNKIYEHPETKDLIIRNVDIKTGQVQFQKVDMVVLYPAVVPSKGMKELCQILGIEQDEFGFIKTLPDNNIETNVPGIYVCGCAHGPEDISTSVAEASAAAAKAASRTSVVKTEEIKIEIPEKVISPDDPPRIGVFICHCGSNIAGVVDVEEVAKEMEKLPNVAYVERNLYTCSEESQNSIKSAIDEHDLNRVIIAACTPRTHLPLFRATCREAGLNPYLVEFASIRELVSWVHMAVPDKATKKAKEQVAMSVAKSRFVVPLQDIEVEILPSTLVIGGGISGMTAALAIAKKGFKVYLVEKEPQLGGLIRNFKELSYDGLSTATIIEKMTEKIQADPHIEVFTSSVIKNVEGSLGNFHATIQHDDKETLIDVGTVVVAVGGHEFKPEGYYLYKKNPNVFTNLEFEALLESGQVKNGEALAFIQCVGSREPQGRTYCSATCCGTSIKNALKVKEKFPNSNIYIFYRDVRVSYTEELEYRLAREKGVNFVQYDASHPPVVREDQNGLILEVQDSFTNDLLKLTFDKIILATPLVTSEENKKLSEMLKVPLDSNGFFLEAHTKLRPVDFATDGVFLCGTAQGPKNVQESMSQALGAASRALKLLMNGKAIVEGITASINEEKCIGCGICVEVCPYGAMSLMEIDKNMGLHKIKVLKARINVGICKGCGACVPECPVNAIDQNNFTRLQISKMIETLIDF